MPSGRPKSPLSPMTVTTPPRGSSAYSFTFPNGPSAPATGSASASVTATPPSPTSMRLAAAMGAAVAVSQQQQPPPSFSTGLLHPTSGYSRSGTGTASRPMSLTPKAMPRVDALRGHTGLRKATSLDSALYVTASTMSTANPLATTYNPYAARAAGLHAGMRFYGQADGGHTRAAATAPAPAALAMATSADTDEAFPEYQSRFFSRDFSCEVLLALRPIPRSA